MFSKYIYNSECYIIALSERTDNREIKVHTRLIFWYVNFVRSFIRGLINADYPPCLGKLSINLHSIPPCFLLPTADLTDNSQSKLFCSIFPALASGQFSHHSASITSEFMNETWILILRPFSISDGILIYSCACHCLFKMFSHYRTSWDIRPNETVSREETGYLTLSVECKCNRLFNVIIKQLWLRDVK